MSMGRTSTRTPIGDLTLGSAFDFTDVGYVPPSPTEGISGSRSPRRTVAQRRRTRFVHKLWRAWTD